MPGNVFLFSLFMIFTGASVLATAALFTRQSLMVAYMFLGLLMGPSGFDLIGDQSAVHQIGDVGIIFLLFLVGLHLDPKNLFQMLRNAVSVVAISSIAFFIIGFLVAYMFGYGGFQSMIVGTTMIFSSTIIGLKLLPNNVLHHQHVGEVIISVLLLQDIIAIFVMMFLNTPVLSSIDYLSMFFIVMALPILLIFSFGFERYVLLSLFNHFEKNREYLFLLSVGWCLGMGELSNLLGLNHEVGAFIAGVSIASSSRISLYLAECLNPVRDFFLVLFFFSIGASFNLLYLPDIILPVIILAVAVTLCKPIIYKFLFGNFGESAEHGWEIGLRLGQSSEFSLILSALALRLEFIGEATSNLIQGATMLTFIISSYLVVKKYPTPGGIEKSIAE